MAGVEDAATASAESWERLRQLALDQHVEAYYAAVAAADVAAGEELAAAVTIQRAWRGFKQRKNERLELVRLVEERLHTAYHGGATKLQALWRGHQSRKRFDFRERKRFLSARMDDIVTMGAALEAHRTKVLAQNEAQKDTIRRTVYNARVGREHHMLSTQARGGVYSTELGGTPEVHESDIKEARRRASLSPIKRTRRSPRPFIVPPAPATLPKVQGPFRPPADVWQKRHTPLRPTLRVETSFTHREEDEIGAKQREWIQRVHDEPFIPVHRTSRPLNPYSADPSTSEPFSDRELCDPKAPITRQLNFRGDSSSGLKAFTTTFTKGITHFDEYN